MNDDDVLSTLRRDWQAQSLSRDGLARRLTAARRRARRALIARYCEAILILGGAFWLSLEAVRDPLYGVAALAFAAALPAALFNLADARRRHRTDHGTAPLGLVRAEGDRIALQRRLLTRTRWIAIILAAAAASLWVVAPRGQTSLLATVLLSGLWAATGVLLWAWQAWRDGVLAKEESRCRAMIADLAEAEDERTAKTIR